jgi:hypothetical protein
MHSDNLHFFAMSSASSKSTPFSGTVASGATRESKSRGGLGRTDGELLTRRFAGPWLVSAVSLVVMPFAKYRIRVMIKLAVGTLGLLLSASLARPEAPAHQASIAG